MPPRRKAAAKPAATTAPAPARASTITRSKAAAKPSTEVAAAPALVSTRPQRKAATKQSAAVAPAPAPAPAPARRKAAAKPSAASAPAPAPTTTKRKAHPTNDTHTKKVAKVPARKSLQNIKYHELVVPPFATEYDPEDFPFQVDGKDYYWLVSEKATKYYEEMCKASDNCCADLWGVYVYNDFTGYGEIELLENVVNAFEKEWRKPRGRKSEELFFRIEALALFLFENEGQWGMCDDGDRVIALEQVLTSMFLEAFILLRNDNLLTPESPIKNIGFVAAVMANAIPGESQGRPRKAVRMCQEAGIRIALGPDEFEHDDAIGIEKFAKGRNLYGGGESDEDDSELEEDSEEEEEEEEGEEELEEEDGGFGKALRHYMRVVGTGKIGGHKFDLSKWSKAELKRHKFGSLSRGYEDDFDLSF